MNAEHELGEILRRYVAVEEDALAKIASELRTLPGSDSARDAARERILKRIELHHQANALIEDAVAKYRESIYFFARRFAEEDLQSDVITAAHVRHAQWMLSRIRKRYSWGDGLLAFGGLLAGAVIPHIASLYDGTTQPSVALLASGLIGTLLFGMGIVEKAKS